LFKNLSFAVAFLSEIQFQYTNMDIKTALIESIDLRKAMLYDLKLVSQIEEAGKSILAVIKNGGTIFTCGNGGSACDAMHFCEELVARYKKDRPGIKSQHFMDSGTLTCWANDYDYASVFERQARTFCSSKDLLVIFSTSGNSENVIRAANAAKEKGSKVIGLLGKGGGKLAPLCDQALIIPSNATERIQEIHITLVHIFCEIIEG